VRACLRTSSRGWPRSTNGCVTKTKWWSSIQTSHRNPGVSNKGGFAFRPWLPGDADLMIRVNEHTTLTDEGREVWALPDA
jgi:hypothetical protein